MSTSRGPNVIVPSAIYANLGLGLPLKLLDGSRLSPVPLLNCAFCTKNISLIKDITKCEKCQRRTYCSKECLVADWEPQGMSQGHKNWCGLEVGEEGLDWELVHVQGRGIGIRALRKMPPYYRIIVEGMDRSKLSTGLQGATTKLTKRAEYTNHECDPNAAYLCNQDDKGLEVAITYSRREIQEGEEISVNYTFFNELHTQNNIHPRVPVEQRVKWHRDYLQSKFGITCAPNCFCFLTELNEQIVKNERLADRVDEVLQRPVGRQESKKLLLDLSKGLEVVKVAPDKLHDFLLMALPAIYSVGGAEEIVQRYLKMDEMYCKSVPHPGSKEAKNHEEMWRNMGFKGIMWQERIKPAFTFSSVGVGQPLVFVEKRSENPESGPFCACCTEKVAGNSVKHCAKCRRRVYCSRKCQVKDWSPKGQGQGHKNWCGVEVCEETLDWELVTVQGRGVGIRSKRDIAALSRIIVEGRGASENRGRAQFANHECDANAALFSDKDENGRNVNIIYAKRDIKEGEEICLNYTECLGDPSKVPAKHRQFLQDQGITCPSHCFCRKPEVGKQIEKNFELFQRLRSLTGKNGDPSKMLGILEEILPGLELVHAPPHYAMQILGVKNVKGHLPPKYRQQMETFCSKVPHPKNKDRLMSEGLF